MQRTPTVIEIAGLLIELRDPARALAELIETYREFERRAAEFRADSRNPHLCHAGCSHCCKSGAVFAVTLAEAVYWAQAIEGLPNERRGIVLDLAQGLRSRQDRVFAEVSG